MHYPTDNPLLQDGVRVLTRTLQRECGVGRRTRACAQSITCARRSGATFTVRTDRSTQFEVLIPPEYRAAFGDDIETRYEVRGVCVTPRAVRDRKAVVHAPEDLVSRPSPP